MTIWIILGVIVIIVLFFIVSYNGFITLKNKVEEAFSTMDVYLVKRHDLIPNIVETVKGYAKHESQTLENVTAARNGAVNASDLDSKLAAENQLTQTIGKLFALSESYPDLKANTNFMDLQKQLQDIETEIAQSRKYYNAVVKEYNIKVESFPSNIIASIFKFGRKPLFEVTSEEQRENVKVEF
ncbi:MAG: LemA family protein [Erysipelotrichales bacterium]